jgi:hypothetical protein
MIDIYHIIIGLVCGISLILIIYFLYSMTRAEKREIDVNESIKDLIKEVRKINTVNTSIDPTKSAIDYQISLTEAMNKGSIVGATDKLAEQLNTGSSQADIAYPTTTDTAKDTALRNAYISGYNTAYNAVDLGDKINEIDISSEIGNLFSAGFGSSAYLINSFTNEKNEKLFPRLSPEYCAGIFVQDSIPITKVNIILDTMDFYKVSAILSNDNINSRAV